MFHRSCTQKLSVCKRFATRKVLKYTALSDLAADFPSIGVPTLLDHEIQSTRCGKSLDLNAECRCFKSSLLLL